jgi:hypothetical protein
MILEYNESVEKAEFQRGPFALPRLFQLSLFFKNLPNSKTL